MRGCRGTRTSMRLRKAGAGSMSKAPDHTRPSSRVCSMLYSSPMAAHGTCKHDHVLHLPCCQLLTGCHGWWPCFGFSCSSCELTWALRPQPETHLLRLSALRQHALQPHHGYTGCLHAQLWALYISETVLAGLKDADTKYHDLPLCSSYRCA